MNDLQLFMRLYMYELELWLNEHKQELKDISFQSDEANTDRPLKEYLKNAIENQCNQLEKLKHTVINSVLLPPISDHVKAILRNRKNAVYTEPDICLMIVMNGHVEYVTVELKSTKSDSIPGSSVQQVLPEEWVIFIKHTMQDIEVATGQYFYAINSKMQFPDRSPRPQVSFSELYHWNSKCRNINDSVIEYSSIGDESQKYALLTDWQNFLAERWVEVVLNRTIRKKEPWFNDNLRKFVLKFLEKYDRMSEKEKDEYKKFLEENI